MHGEVFSGLLVPFLKSVLKKTNEGFEMMNKALADEVRARLSSGISYNEK